MKKGLTMTKNDRLLAKANVLALIAKAERLEEQSGLAAHQRRLSRNNYTHDPIHRETEHDVAAQKARAKAQAIVERVWDWYPHANPSWVATLRDYQV
jgi:hypothetical protein